MASIYVKKLSDFSGKPVTEITPFWEKAKKEISKQTNISEVKFTEKEINLAIKLAKEKMGLSNSSSVRPIDFLNSNLSAEEFVEQVTSGDFDIGNVTLNKKKKKVVKTEKNGDDDEDEKEGDEDEDMDDEEKDKKDKEKKKKKDKEENINPASTMEKFLNENWHQDWHNEAIAYLKDNESEWVTMAVDPDGYTVNIFPDSDISDFDNDMIESFGEPVEMMGEEILALGNKASFVLIRPE